MASLVLEWSGVLVGGSLPLTHEILCKLHNLFTVIVSFLPYPFYRWIHCSRLHWGSDRAKDKTYIFCPLYKLFCYNILPWSSRFWVLGEPRGWIHKKHARYLGIGVSDALWPASISSLISCCLLTGMQCLHHAKLTASRPCHALPCLPRLPYAVPIAEEALLYLAILQGPVQTSLPL